MIVSDPFDAIVCNSMKVKSVVVNDTTDKVRINEIHDEVESLSLIMDKSNAIFPIKEFKNLKTLSILSYSNVKLYNENCLQNVETLIHNKAPRGGRGLASLPNVKNVFITYIPDTLSGIKKMKSIESITLVSDDTDISELKNNKIKSVVILSYNHDMPKLSWAKVIKYSHELSF
jgi:hypothetical protein